MINRYKYPVAVFAIVAASASFAQTMNNGVTTSSTVAPTINSVPSSTIPSANRGLMGSAPVNNGHSGSSNMTSSPVQGDTTSAPNAVTPASGYSTPSSTSGASATGSSMTGSAMSSNGYDNAGMFGSGAASRAYVESSPLLNPNNPHVAPQIGAPNFNLYSGGN